MTSGFGLTQVVPTALRPLMREHSAGLFSVGAWYLARSLADIPYELVSGW
jgi:hypothetical protein